MAAITATTHDKGQHIGTFKVDFLTFTSSGTNAANVTDTITLSFKRVSHVIGVGSALVDPTWSFNESTGVLSLTVNGGTKTSVMIVGI